MTEDEAENVSLLKLLVQIVVKKTLYLSNQEVIVQFFAAIVSSLKDKDNPKEAEESLLSALIARERKLDAMHSSVFLWQKYASF